MSSGFATRQPLPPLQPPSATSGLLEVFRRRYLLRLLVRREVSARYQGSALGMLWSYVNPLSQFLIYYFLIGKILGLDLPPEGRADILWNTAARLFG